MACHRCQTGGQSWGQPFEAPPRAAPRFPLVYPLAGSPAQRSPQGRWSWGAASEPAVEVFSLQALTESQSVGCGGALSLPPSGSCADQQTSGSGSAPHCTDGEIETLREI